MANYVPLRRIVANAETSAILINNLPTSGYSHLKVVTTLRVTNGSANWALISYNTQPDTTVDLRHIIGDANSAASQAYSSGRVFTNNTSLTSDTFAVSEFVIYNYNDPNHYKVIMSQSGQETNTTSPRPSTSVSAQMWNSNLPINSIRFTVDGGGNFAASSSISVYGLPSQFDTPVVSPKATGGNIITTDGNYWYHAFLSTGTFNPKISLSCEYLAVAGGGGGSAWDFAGGGGGAGGVVFGSGIVNFASTVTVGAGGAGTTTNYSPGGDGGNSQFAGLTLAIGGGGGGASNAGTSTGRNGGSGGGGGSGNSASGGTGTAGQGNNGGAGFSGQKYPGGGGGGAGAAGANYVNSATAGAGGAGTGDYGNWLFATGTGVAGYIAGGGGGGVYAQYGGGAAVGAGGIGGGGQGGVGSGGGVSSVAGTANTGSGGGGNGGGTNGSAGGSGIVIVRYAV